MQRIIDWQPGRAIRVYYSNNQGLFRMKADGADVQEIDGSMPRKNLGAPKGKISLPFMRQMAGYPIKALTQAHCERRQNKTGRFEQEVLVDKDSAQYVTVENRCVYYINTN